MVSNRHPKRSLEKVLLAIENSRGVKQVIADRLGVHRATFNVYLKRWKTVKDAYEEETAVTLDDSYSVIATNIENAKKRQKLNAESDDVDKQLAQVDSSDARWYLMIKGREMGFIPTNKVIIDSEPDIMIVLDNPHLLDGDHEEPGETQE